jgi:hypothetical protein
MNKLLLTAAALAFATVAMAKLPAPVLSNEAKAKAAEAAAKTAYNGKVDGYKLCLSMDKTAGHYYKTSKSAKPATATPPCADPGPFVFPLPVAAMPAPAAATTAAAAPAAPAAPAAATPAKKS